MLNVTKGMQQLIGKIRNRCLWLFISSTSFYISSYFNIKINFPGRIQSQVPERLQASCPSNAGARSQSSQQRFECKHRTRFTDTLRPINLVHNKFGYENFGYHNFSHKFRNFLVYNNFSHIFSTFRDHLHILKNLTSGMLNKLVVAIKK